MVGTYASAALICAASLLVGRCVLALSGRSAWSWLEPAVGFATLLTVAGLLAHAPGSAATATVGLAALVAVAGARAACRPAGSRVTWREGLPVVVILMLALSLPFATSGFWGLPGTGNLQMHLNWAGSLHEGAHATLPAGLPLGPHGLASAAAAVPGIGLSQALVGEAVAIILLGGLTALGAIGHMGAIRRTVAAVLVALPYLVASSFAQGALRGTAGALFVLATGIFLLQIERRETAGAGAPEALSPAAEAAAPTRAALAPLALAGGVFFSNGLVGLVWPLAIVGRWSLNRTDVRDALRPRSLVGPRRQRPPALAMLVVLAALAIVAIVAGPWDLDEIAAQEALASVSAIEGLGIWPSASHGSSLPGIHLAGAAAVLTTAIGLFWWVRRREAALPVAFGVSFAIYLLAPVFGGRYSAAQALAIVAPVAMLVAVRPVLEETGPGTTPLRRDWPRIPSIPWTPPHRVGWAILAIAFIGGAVYSSFLALRDAPVTPADRETCCRGASLELGASPLRSPGQSWYQTGKPSAIDVRAYSAPASRSSSTV